MWRPKGLFVILVFASGAGANFHLPLLLYIWLAQRVKGALFFGALDTCSLFGVFGVPPSLLLGGVFSPIVWRPPRVGTKLNLTITTWKSRAFSPFVELHRQRGPSVACPTLRSCVHRPDVTGFDQPLHWRWLQKGVLILAIFCLLFGKGASVIWLRHTAIYKLSCKNYAGLDPYLTHRDGEQ